MNHDMRAAILVKKSLNNYLLLSRHYAERQLCRSEIVNDLFRRAMTYTNLINEPLNTGSADVLVRSIPMIINPFRNFITQTRYRLRKFFRTPRRLAQPERNRRRLSVR